MTSKLRTKIAVLVVAASIAAISTVSVAQAELGVKLVGEFGAPGTAAGQLTAPFGIGLDQSHGTLYVAEETNNRVQEFTTSGVFVSMFGRNVDKTKVVAGAPQLERDVCTAASNDVCQAGEGGSGEDQFKIPVGVAVDQSSGAVYVADFSNHRVEKYDSNGHFLYMVGGKVNTNGTNLCAAGEVCQIGEAGSGNGQFRKFAAGDLVAVGGPAGKMLLYVGDEERIDEFDPATGAWVANINVSSLGASGVVQSLAVDSLGRLYVRDNASIGVRELEVVTNGGGELEGHQIAEFDNTGEATVQGLAIDDIGDLALIDSAGGFHGALYTTNGKHAVFGAGFIETSHGIAIEKDGQNLYVVDTAKKKVYRYHKTVLPTTVTIIAPEPVPDEIEGKISVMVEGEINPEGVDTTGLFEYGLCNSPTTCEAGGYAANVPAVLDGTSIQDLGSGEGFESVEGVLKELQPNKTYHYRLVGHNKDGQTAGVEGKFGTPVVPPRIERIQTAFVGPHSGELIGLVNPENNVTTYKFEYGLCATVETCATSPYSESTLTGSAGENDGLDGVYADIVGLNAGAIYHFRLIVTDGSVTVSSTEGTFTTPVEPPTPTSPPGTVPTVVTGAASGVADDTAVIAGTVNPHASSTDYVFEVGIYNGGETRFGIVSSGGVGAGVDPTNESYKLTNLQAGVTYAFRIRADNVYGTTFGNVVTFATAPAPVVFTAPIAPQLLQTPPIPFPGEAPVKKLTRAQELKRALKACQKKPKHKRAACRRAARKKYAMTKA